MLDRTYWAIYADCMEMPSKTCERCGAIFHKHTLISKSKWETRRFCGPVCGNKGKNMSHLKQYSFEKGQSASPATQFKKGQMSKEANVNWKGDEASYAAKHIWIRYNHGSPQLCEKCGTTEKRMYHWANISRTYKRERSDWLRLCVPCHKRHDLERKEPHG